MALHVQRTLDLMPIYGKKSESNVSIGRVDERIRPSSHTSFSLLILVTFICYILISLPPATVTVVYASV